MNNKLKILLVSPYSAKRVGGIGTWSKIVLDYAERQNECTVSFLNTVQGLPKRWAMNKNLAHLIIGGLDSAFILVRLFWQMLVNSPDVVHYTSSAGSALKKDLIAIWIVKKIFHKKFVIHWHFGLIPTIFEKKGNEYKNFIRVCDNCDISIPIDEKSYNVLQKHGIHSVYIPNPIPVSLQHEAEKLSLKDASIYRNDGEVLFVGHVLKGKGVLELVEACLNCEKLKHLIIVGPFLDERLKNDIISLASKRDNGNWLKLLGEKKREDVWDYYKSCAMFCLPSYSEGFPYVILEAMSFGCPIVATRVGAIPEMLSDGCGVLIEAREVESLEKAINQMLSNSNSALKMGENAHDKVLKQYTIDILFDKYYKVWKNC